MADDKEIQVQFGRIRQYDAMGEDNLHRTFIRIS